MQRTEGIRETVTRIFAECDALQTHPYRAAMRGAEKRLRAAARARFASKLQVSNVPTPISSGTMNKKEM